MIVGITGGIATGKTTVTSMLQVRGAVTFSADEAARAILYKNGPAYIQVVSTFGDRVITDSGEIDRAVLGSIIFQDEDSRLALNAIMHPQIRRLLFEQIESAKYDFPLPNIIITEIPLLYEGRLESWFEHVVVVAASVTVQTNRLVQRNQLSETQAAKRIQVQMPLAEKIAQASYVVWNDGDIEELSPQVDNLWKNLVERASPGNSSQVRAKEQFKKSACVL